VSVRRLLLPLLLLLLAAMALGGVKYRVDRVRCTGCGDCDRICPVNAVEMIDGYSCIDPDACIGCGMCQGVCSHEAIR
jgi:MinD superfamily P-loop ATPase